MEMTEFNVAEKVKSFRSLHGANALIQARQVLFLVPFNSKQRDFWNEVVFRLEV